MLARRNLLVHILQSVHSKRQHPMKAARQALVPPLKQHRTWHTSPLEHCPAQYCSTTIPALQSCHGFVSLSAMQICWLYLPIWCASSIMMNIDECGAGATTIWFSQVWEKVQPGTYTSGMVSLFNCRGHHLVGFVCMWTKFHQLWN